MTAPGRAQQSAAGLASGVVLLLCALTCFGLAKLVASTQRHSYDPHATPPATYSVTAGKTYQLATSGGVAPLVHAGVIGGQTQLSCLSTSEDGVQTGLQLDSVKDDARDLHVFATWRALTTDRVHISCSGVPAVFLDNADDSPPDYSALMIVLATVLGTTGIISLAAGAYRRSSEPADAEPADGSET